MNLKHENVNAKSGIFTFIKKRKLQIGLMTMISSALTFNIAFATDLTKDMPKTQEIYHIYDGESYLGAVQNEQKIEALIDAKQQQANEQYTQYNLEVGSNITVVPEQVFSAVVDEVQVLQQLEQSIDVEAEAMSVTIGDRTVAYVQDADSFNEMIKQLKLQFVTEEQLNVLNTNTNTIPELQKDETRLRSVTIQEQITTELTQVAPEQIQDPKKLARRLVEGSIVTKHYPVHQGDTLKSIANAYGLTVNELVKMNKHLTVDSVPQVGELLSIETVEPYVNVEVKYEVLKKTSIDFEKEVKESSSLLKGKSKVEREGQNGKREVVYLIADVNGDRKSKAAISDEVVKEPVNEVKIVGTKEVPHVGGGSFAWPAVGGYVSSQKGPRWGRNHDGIDIARPSDYTIKASDNGKIVKASKHSTYGNYVVIDHNNGYETLYAHLSSISVSVGQTVAQGQKIGVMGSTGRSTGTHLHFEVRKNGALLNPLSVLK